MQVSAIIPTYNYGHVVGRAIQSVLDQSYPVAEIIVVDDGSTDDTADAVAAVARAHHGHTIRYLRQENAGPSAARNHGARAAGSPWIAYLDADDYWYRHKIAAQTAFLAQVPNAALLFSGVDMETIDGIQKPAKPPRAGYYSWAELLRENWVFSPTPLLRRDVFFAAGEFDESRRYAEDWDCWLRMAETAPVAGQRDALARYLDHGTGLHASSRMIRGSWSVLGAALARGVQKLHKNDADRAMAALLASEAVGAAGRRDMHGWAEKARAAARLDAGQAPRLAWAALFMAVRGRLYA
jgi:glycosyltransferase involved in cell wall biosynthesis